MICQEEQRDIGASVAWSKRRVVWTVYLPPLAFVALECSLFSCKRRVFLNDDLLFKGAGSPLSPFSYKFALGGYSATIREHESFQFELTLQKTAALHQEYRSLESSLTMSSVLKLEESLARSFSSVESELMTIRLLDCALYARSREKPN